MLFHSFDLHFGNFRLPFWHISLISGYWVFEWHLRDLEVKASVFCQSMPVSIYIFIRFMKHYIVFYWHKSNYIKSFHCGANQLIKCNCNFISSNCNINLIFVILFLTKQVHFMWLPHFDILATLNFIIWLHISKCHLTIILFQERFTYKVFMYNAL